MRNVNVYYDGKVSRARKAQILKTKSKRHLIRYYDPIEEVYVEGWFRKIRRDLKGVYYLPSHNMLFYGWRERKGFEEYIKTTYSKEFVNFLLNH